MIKEYTTAGLKGDPGPIMEVFFDAMLAGYAGKPDYSSSGPTARIRISKGKGVTSIWFEDDLWKVEDEYRTILGSHRSYGTTVISYDNKLVWIMHYFGQYDSRAIPILKAALSDNYGSRLFLGGRGPKRYENEDGVYYNQDSIAFRDFENFKGYEVVKLKDGVDGGFHHYHGGLMI